MVCRLSCTSYKCILLYEYLWPLLPVYFTKRWYPFIITKCLNSPVLEYIAIKYTTPTKLWGIFYFCFCLFLLNLLYWSYVVYKCCLVLFIFYNNLYRVTCIILLFTKFASIKEQIIDIIVLCTCFLPLTLIYHTFSTCACF